MKPENCERGMDLRAQSGWQDQKYGGRDCASTSSRNGEQAEGWVNKDPACSEVAGRARAKLEIEGSSGIVEASCVRRALQPCAVF